MGGRAAVRPAVLVRPQSPSSYGPTSVAPLVLAFVSLPPHHACTCDLYLSCTCPCPCRKSSVHACSCICLHRACVRACVCACVCSLCVLRSVVDPTLPHSLRLQCTCKQGESTVKVSMIQSAGMSVKDGRGQASGGDRRGGKGQILRGALGCAVRACGRGGKQFREPIFLPREC